MISCFLKAVGEENAVVCVEKFLDRIWIEDNGNAQIMRTIILNCADGEGISGFTLVIPFPLKEDTITDLTSTGIDAQYYWNGRETNQHNVIDDQKRLIQYDGIEPIYVPTMTTIKVQALGDVSLVHFSFPHKIPPKTRVFVRVEHRCNHFATVKRDKDVVFQTRYLSLNGVKRGIGKYIDLVKLQMPIRPLLDVKTKSGGFDIFVTSPENTRLAFEPVSASIFHKSITDFNGQNIESRDCRCWRLRFQLDASLWTTPVYADHSVLYVAGQVVRDFWKETIQSDIKRIQSEAINIRSKAEEMNDRRVQEIGELTEDLHQTDKLARIRDYIAITIGILALILAISLYLLEH